MTRVVVESDGGSRGNPGPAGYGSVVRAYPGNEILVERYASLGVTTNNVAEYTGLIEGLKAARELNATEVDVRMDSRLVVEQMSGRWRISHPDMQAQSRRAHALIDGRDVSFDWVPRLENARADAAANEAMDRRESFRRDLDAGRP